MAISKNFLWETIDRLTGEIERLDPQSAVAARMRGFLEARQMGLHTTDRHKTQRGKYGAAAGQDDLVANLYLSGKSTYTIAAEVGRSVQFVKGALNRCGIKPRKPGESQKAGQRCVDQERLDRIRAMLAEGKNLSQIGALEHVSRERVRQICKQAGIDTTPVLTIDQKAAVQEYLDGGSLLEVAERHSVHQTTVKKWVLSEGHELRPKVRRTQSKTLRKASRAAQMYKAGASSTNIAAALGVPQPYVYRLLAIAGVTPRSRQPQQEAA
jgi:transposase